VEYFYIYFQNIEYEKTHLLKFSKYAYRPFGYRVFTPALSVVETPVYWRSVWRAALKNVAKRVNKRRAAKR
jgi:hypothetical protein